MRRPIERLEASAFFREGSRPQQLSARARAGQSGAHGAAERCLRRHEPRARRPAQRLPSVSPPPGADEANGLNAIVPADSAALLFRWRGYADSASRARPAPRFHGATGLVAETLSSPLLATLGAGSGRPAPSFSRPDPA